MIQKTTRRKTRKPSSSALYSLDLGTWGRFYVHPRPENFKMPRFPKSGAGLRISRQCLHCKQWFKTNREEQRFCKDGCRTYNNRLKRAAIVRWMIDQGVPTFTALDTLDVSGMAEVARKMEALGLFWDGMEWEKK